MSLASEMAAFTHTDVTETGIQDGIRYELTRDGWRAKIDVYKDHAVWQWIEGGGLREAHDMLPILKERGCEYLIADIDEESVDHFRTFGDWHSTTYKGRHAMRLWL